MSEISGSGPAAAEDFPPEGGEHAEATAGPQTAAMVPVGVLAAHPGNVREDLDLSTEFCASVAEAGVRVPLLVTPGEDGGFRVVEGHRRLAAALKAGLAEVPCVLAAAGDLAAELLDMAVANSSSHRRNFTPAEEALALFAAHEAGANRTRIRKATGRTAGEVKMALKAGQISPESRAQAGELAAQMSLEELALLAEFDGDDDAVAKIVTAVRYEHNVEYTAERIRQDRAEAAEHERLRTQLEKDGYTIAGEPPPGGAYLTALVHDGAELTAEAHAQCPGRGVIFRPWNKLAPVHYCADPTAHGHTSLFQPAPAPGAQASPGIGGAGPDSDGTPEGEPSPVPEPAPDPGRRLVIEGNKAWAAAAEVRKKWVAQLLARRTAPPQVARFVTVQVLTMPEPLRRALPIATARQVFSDLAGRDGAQAVEMAATCPAARLPLLMLAPIATAYESEMAGDVVRRSTWREDQFSPCPRADAGRYLAFLASLGYPLAPIEQAVADGVPYAGDNPAPQLPTDGDGDGEGAESITPDDSAVAGAGAGGAVGSGEEAPEAA
jgi:ParB family transcriptional regulator, chromosome partitioning protein